MSEWLKVMLEEVERKQQEAAAHAAEESPPKSADQPDKSENAANSGGKSS